MARDVLAQILWNAVDGANALTNLRSALRRVRTAIETANGDTLPMDYLVADRATLMLNPAAPIWVDVGELLGCVFFALSMVCRTLAVAL